MAEPQAFESWAVVELFGHQQIAGKVTEQVIAGQGFVRVDVPETEERPGFTRMFGPGAIYSIIPADETVIRLFARRNVSAPIQPYQLAQPQIPARIRQEAEDEDESFVLEDAPF